MHLWVSKCRDATRGVRREVAETPAVEVTHSGKSKSKAMNFLCYEYQIAGVGRTEGEFTMLVTGGVRQARLGSPNRQNTAKPQTRQFRPGNGTKTPRQIKTDTSGSRKQHARHPGQNPAVRPSTTFIRKHRTPTSRKRASNHAKGQDLGYSGFCQSLAGGASGHTCWDFEYANLGCGIGQGKLALQA